MDSGSCARAGSIHLQHGIVQTPVFMPVGTQATVKTMTSQELEACRAQMILSNTYHLYLRPGESLLRQAGGLHRFMSWDHPILTDSGGFQIFSLADLRKVMNEGVRFQSHIDGSSHTLTPESVIDIQRNLGSDIMMVLDECLPYPSTDKDLFKAHERTLLWAERSLDRFRSTVSPYGFDQALFGIVQGGTDEEIREKSDEGLLQLDLNGYAIGGLAVGEPVTLMLRIIEKCTALLPHEKPRYLMGVGKPEDILQAIGSGVDMFDCVIPTRNARRGTVYTWTGKIVLRNRLYQNDLNPIDPGCSCTACRHYSRAFIRHLFQAGEILGMRLATIHNIHFYMDLISQARVHILQDDFTAWRQSLHAYYPLKIHETVHSIQGGPCVFT
jgi:queuine tRNA-ribosyltransferase